MSQDTCERCLGNRRSARGASRRIHTGLVPVYILRPTAATASSPIRTAMVGDSFPVWTSRPSWWETARS
jgi:hypothetical protein